MYSLVQYVKHHLDKQVLVPLLCTGLCQTRRGRRRNRNQGSQGEGEVDVIMYHDAPVQQHMQQDAAEVCQLLLLMPPLQQQLPQSQKIDP